MNVAFLCLGGNMGDRLACLREARNRIGGVCGKITAASTIYETAAWGVENSPDYYNQCLKLETELNAEELLERLLNIEKEMGRVRSGRRNEARMIDLDLLLFNDEILEKAHCHVPHPRLHLRQFVLKPLNGIASDVVHPVLHKTIRQLLTECTDTSAVKAINDNVHLH